MCIEHPLLLIQTFISGILDENKFKDYLLIIKEYNKFKNLFDKFLKDEIGILNKVKDIIMNESYFSIQLYSKEKNIYELNGCYKKSLFLEQGNDKTDFLKSFEIDELYERVFISKNQNVKTDYVEIFIIIYKYMKNLNNLINDIFLNYGYPEEIVVELKIKQNIKFFLNGKECTSMEISNHFAQINQECHKILYKSIATSDEIRLFYGKQLYLINECLKKNNLIK